VDADIWDRRRRVAVKLTNNKHSSTLTGAGVFFMYYFWNKNKTAEVWFRNKRKPPEQNNKMVDDAYSPTAIMFGSELCRQMFNSDLPTVEKFAVLRLVKLYGGYRASGSFFVNDFCTVGKIQKYDFVNKYYTSSDALLRIAEVNFFTRNCTYEMKLLGCDETIRTGRKKEMFGCMKANLGRSTVNMYVELMMDMPNIAQEIFTIIPEVKSKNEKRE
jgi:hypothetical protein